jgi:hypothetical protein
MADFKVVGKLVIDDKGQLKVLGKKAKGASKELDKVGTSAQTADRRLKGAAQASSGGSKNFSKMAQGINGGLVPAYATLAASLFAIGALFRGLEEAANIKNQTKGMEIFGEATGIAMKGIVADLRAATGGMLDFRNAAQQAQIATAAGFSGEQIIELGKGAKLASVALGRDLTDSFNRLLRGVTKAEPELLDELGIILRIDDATRKYAQANDLVAAKLTITQRRAAVFEEVSRQLANNFSAFEDGADGALNSFSRLQVAFSDIIKGLTSFIGPLEYVAEFLAANTGAAAVIFAGFASSIMKSAFPALTNMTLALKGYKATSESSLRAEKVKFMQYSAMFKKNANDARLAELKKSATFKKFLKKRGMDQKRFDKMLPVNQRRSIALMITNLQKRAAAGKAINDAELAYFIKTRQQMVAAQGFSFAKMKGIAVAGSFAVGNALGAAVTVPALLARVGLAKVGAAALALAPIFATLGAIISGAFTILTVGFLAKFLYETVFITKEEKEERGKIKSILDDTAVKLKEIRRIGKNIFDDMVDNADAPLNRLNARLLSTYNLVRGISSGKAMEDYESKFTTTAAGRGTKMVAPELGAVGGAEMTSNIMKQIGLLDSMGGFDNDMLQQLKNINKQNDTSSGLGLYSLNKALGPGGGGVTDDLLDNLQRDLVNMFEDGYKGDLRPLLRFLNNELTVLAKPGEGLYNVSEAAKTVKDTLAVMSDGYKPTTFDTLNTQMLDLANNLEGAIGGSGKGAYHKEIEEILGMSFDSSEKALEAISAMSTDIANVVTENARILDAQSNLSMRTAGLGSRKDAFSVLERKKIKELQITEQIADVTNKINSETYFLKLAEKEGEEVAERKLRTMERQLDVLKAQEKEYNRANTIAGQLQDTFQDGLDNTFQSIIDGTAKAKDAFKQLAVVVIQEMQRILAVRMASQIIQMMSGLFVPGGAEPGQSTNSAGDVSATGRLANELPPGALSGRYGGTFGNKGYASGGIADGPDSGYNVLMHGREAIVPLPDGDKIPVQLTGKGQGPVNSVINVTVNNEGDVESSAEESSALGEAIQMAVTREIAEQQRPGGLLSPI